MKTIYVQTLEDFLRQVGDVSVHMSISKRDDVGDDVVESILGSPEAVWIEGLDWLGHDPPVQIGDLPLPRLVKLELEFRYGSLFDWLEHTLPNYPNLRKLRIHITVADRNSENFFRRLRESSVEDLEIHCGPRIRTDVRPLLNYPMGDKLRRLVVWGGELAQTPTPNLRELELRNAKVAQPLVVSESMRRVELWDCVFVPEETFGSLALSNLEELVIGSDIDNLGPALVQLLDRQVLVRLTIRKLSGRMALQLGASLGRVGILDLCWSSACGGALGLALGDPDSRIRELMLRDVGERDLPAIWSMLIGSRVEKLQIMDRTLADRPACVRMEERYRKVVRLLVVLQGQRVRRFQSPLHRLPVEMIRLVGQMSCTNP